MSWKVFERRGCKRKKERFGGGDWTDVVVVVVINQQPHLDSISTILLYVVQAVLKKAQGPKVLS